MRVSGANGCGADGTAAFHTTRDGDTYAPSSHAAGVEASELSFSLTAMLMLEPAAAFPTQTVLKPGAVEKLASRIFSDVHPVAMMSPGKGLATVHFRAHCVPSKPLMKVGNGDIHDNIGHDLRLHVLRVHLFAFVYLRKVMGWLQIS